MNQGSDARFSQVQNTGLTGAEFTSSDEHSVADIFISPNQSSVDGVTTSSAETGRVVSQGDGGGGSNAVFDTGTPVGVQFAREDASNSAVAAQEAEKAAKEAKQQKLAEALGGEREPFSEQKVARQQVEQDSNAQAMARENDIERREQVKIRQQEMEVRQLEARQAEVLAHEIGRAHV